MGFCVAKDQESYSVRTLTTDDLQIFKTIRIQAIHEHPEAFLDTPEKATNRKDDEWRSIFEGQNKCLFGLFYHDKLVGIGSVFQPDPHINSGHLAMGYITQDHRGKGLSGMLYKARIEWTRNNTDFENLTICHRKGNEASRRAMLKFGFEYYGEEDEIFGDQLTEKNLKYRLSLT